MPLAWWILALVALQRLAELVHARRNEARLRSRGAIEHGAPHYPLLVLLHAAWLLALFAATDAGSPVVPWLLGLFVLLQVGRLWVLVSLGPWWTTRILTLPDAPLVRRGPYRFLKHPNYLIVAAEIAVLPLVFQLWPLALGFSLANALLLGWRIRVEEHAIAGRRSLAPEA